MSLSEDQQAVFDAVVVRRENVFFTGDAGSGKSHVLRAMVQALRSAKQSVYVTASTGIAACSIGGVTIHSFAGIGTGADSLENLLRRIGHGSKAAARWRRCSTLFIDEISMLDGTILDKLNEIAKSVRGNALPFGGMQVVCTGDFFQLPPVSQRLVFCFETEAWRSTIGSNAYCLTTIFRQQDDAFIRILREMRVGIVSRKTEETLRALDVVQTSSDDLIEYTQLCPRNDDCDRINQMHMAQLSGREHVYHATDWHAPGEDAVFESFHKSCAALPALTLKKGAQVILLQNTDLEGGLVNGARGVVLGFMNESSTEGECVQVKADSETFVPYVRFITVHQHKTECAVPCTEFVIEREGKKIATRRQIPLKLAWSISIHKSQGMTIPRLSVSMKGVFEYGQAYVALSRAVGLDSLRVQHFVPSVVRAHPRVIAFYKSIEPASSSAAAAATSPSAPGTARGGPASAGEGGDAAGEGTACGGPASAGEGGDAAGEGTACGGPASAGEGGDASVTLPRERVDELLRIEAEWKRWSRTCSFLEKRRLMSSSSPGEAATKTRRTDE